MTGVQTCALPISSSTGLASVSVDGATVTYRLTLVLPELPEGPRRLLAAAAEGDAAAAEQAVEELRRRVAVRSGDAACRPGRATVRGSRLGDGRVDLEMAFRCEAPPSRLVLRDGWAALFGEHHQTLARVEGPGGPHQLAFSASQPEGASSATQLTLDAVSAVWSRASRGPTVTWPDSASIFKT